VTTHSIHSGHGNSIMLVSPPSISGVKPSRAANDPHGQGSMWLKLSNEPVDFQQNILYLFHTNGEKKHKAKKQFDPLENIDIFIRN
jgi:hypothetical protein